MSADGRLDNIGSDWSKSNWQAKLLAGNGLWAANFASVERKSTFKLETSGNFSLCSPTLLPVAIVQIKAISKACYCYDFSTIPLKTVLHLNSCRNWVSNCKLKFTKWQTIYNVQTTHVL